MMATAILAWGSLIWDKRKLQIIGDWYKGGPFLPIEFSRISKDGRLTLVITEEYGTEIETYWAISRYTTLDDAIKDLRKREGTNRNGIGYIDLKNESYRSYGVAEY